MKSFLDHNSETFELLVFEHLKKMKQGNSKYAVTNEKKEENV